MADNNNGILIPGIGAAVGGFLGALAVVMIVSLIPQGADGVCADINSDDGSMIVFPSINTPEACKSFAIADPERERK